MLVHADEYDRWLNGSFEDAVAFQARCYPEELIEMTRTDELWVKRNAIEIPPPML